MVQVENLYTKDCIRTSTGIYMNVFEPTLEMIRIEDIAHALSNIPRFGGHLPSFYSVAQHCVLSASIIQPALKIDALLHDASEAYLMDIPKPIKQRLTNYENIENGLMELIARKYKFKYPLAPEVKGIDKFMLEWEWSTLMLKRKTFPEIKSLWPCEAEELFLTTFDELQNVK